MVVEHAARGGLDDVAFHWGTQELNDMDHYPCNNWQGHFLKSTKLETATSQPAGRCPLHQMPMGCLIWLEMSWGGRRILNV